MAKNDRVKLLAEIEDLLAKMPAENTETIRAQVATMPDDRLAGMVMLMSAFYKQLRQD